ncbi:MAG: helix-turn-helix transcriptional regulator [Cyclobacteriaceae bacterium]
MNKFSKSLIAASSRPLILAILQQGPSYGYSIIQQVKELSRGDIEWTDGMMYPILHRLEKEGLVVPEWKQTDGGRHRKYYAITDQGKLALHGEKEDWIKMNTIIMKLWDLNVDSI